MNNSLPSPSLQKYRRQQKLRRIRHNILVGMLTALLAVFALFILSPTVLTMTNSLMSTTEILSNYGKIFENVTGSSIYIAEQVTLKLIPDMVSAEQYITTLLKSPEYLFKFWNSVILVLPITVLQIIVALGAAYAFARFKTKFRSVLFFIYIIIMLMPYQVTLVPNFMVSKALGILDTRWAIILPGIFSPFAVFILTKFMRRIPHAMLEAAKLDGCNELELFWLICIPQCRSTIYSVAILVFIDYWNMVEQPLVLMANDDLHPLSVFLSQINAGEPGLAFAIATIYMIPTLLLFLYSEDYLVEGIAYAGSVKG